MADQKPAPRPPALKPNDLRNAATERGYYVAIVPSDLTFEQVMTPAFWQHHVALLSGGQTKRPFARVEVMREDGTMDLDLRVVSTAPGMVVMRCLRKYVSDENLAKPKGGAAVGDDKLQPPDGYKWAHVPRGESPGHMIRLPNSDVLVKGEPTKAAAVAKAWAHFKAATAVPAEPAT